MGLMKKLFNNTRKPEGFLGSLMVNTMNKGHAKVSDWGISNLPATLDPKNIADLGCGGGRNAEVLLEKYPNAELTALDYSDVSVEKSRKRNHKTISEGRCSVMQGDVSDLPMMDDYFDLVTAFETVYFWPGPEKSFKEVYRVLKDDGLFMIVNESDGYNEKDLKWVDIVDGMRMYNDKELESMLKSVGFRDVQIHRMEKNSWLSLIARK